MCKFSVRGSVTHCVFPYQHQDWNTAVLERTSSTFKHLRSFFFGGSEGVISYADEMGHCMVRFFFLIFLFSLTHSLTCPLNL